MYVLVGGNRSYKGEICFIPNNKISMKVMMKKMVALTVSFTAAIVKMSNSTQSLDSLGF